MAESKYLKKVQGNGASTTLSGSVSAVATSAPLTADTAFAGEGMVIIDEGQATEEFAYATAKVGSSLTILADDRGLEGGSAQAHASTATVKGIVTAGMWNNLITGVTNVLVNTTGALDTTKVVDLTTAQTLTNKTLTSPKIGTNIKDTNGNELITLTATGSAVNEVTLANGATGTGPTFTASGDDTNIDLNLKGKGSGNVRLGTAGLKFPNADGSANQSLVTDGSGTLSFAAAGSTDGWTAATGTWTYASASTITVPSGAASIYQIGDRIKWTQTTVKYGVIVAVADTLLTILVNTDYTVANAAITSPYYSHQSSPVGFPGAFTWTPVWSLEGGTLTTTYSSQTGKVRINGREVTATYAMSLNVVTTATASKPFQFSYPVAPGTGAANSYKGAGTGIFLDAGTGFYSYIIELADASVVKCFNADVTTSANRFGAVPAITLATGDEVGGTFSYFI